MLTFILAASNGGNILGTYMKKNMDDEMEAGLTSGTYTNFCCWLLAGSRFQRGSAWVKGLAGSVVFCFGAGD